MAEALPAIGAVGGGGAFKRGIDAGYVSVSRKVNGNTVMTSDAKTPQ